MRTAVVILNWNTVRYLEQFLPALVGSMPADAEVIVADSASTDGSMDMLSEKFPSVRQIRLDRNYGFTGGYNRAFKAVRDLPEAADLDYFLLINSDIEVPPGWLEPLVAWMDGHPDCAACGPKLRSYFQKDTFEYAGAAGGCLDRFGFPFCRGRVLRRVERDNGQYDSPADVLWVTGACLLVRKRAYEAMGGLDDRFFAHMEEIDLCWRLQLEGCKVTVVPQSVVYHLGGGTLPNDSPWKLRLNYRNNLLLLENNLAKTYALRLLGAGRPPEEAARKACRSAKRTLFLRQALDGCSALVYLLTGKFDYVRSVREAHREFRKLRRGIRLPAVREYAARHRTVAPPEIYSRWIVPLAFLKKEGIFEYLRKTS